MPVVVLHFVFIKAVFFHKSQIFIQHISV